MHRFYQEQYQLDGGAQDRYVTGSDASGSTMGYYDTKTLPIYKYLHAKGTPHYAIDDNFFQRAFGGSFLNHQWLIAAATPVWIRRGATAAARDDLHSVLDANGMPNNYPLYASPLGTDVKDQQLTRRAARPRPGRRSSRRSCAATTPSTRRSRSVSRTRRARRSTRRLPLQTGADDRRPAVRRPASTGRGTRAAGTNADGDATAPGSDGRGGDADRLLRPERRHRRAAGRPVAA